MKKLFYIILMSSMFVGCDDVELVTNPEDITLKTHKAMESDTTLHRLVIDEDMVYIFTEDGELEYRTHGHMSNGGVWYIVLTTIMSIFFIGMILNFLIELT